MVKIKLVVSNTIFILCLVNYKMIVKKIILGIIAGIVCGLFGTGGGLILVPAFIYMLKLDPKKSRGTSLSCMLVMVIVSSIFYSKNKYIDWKLGILCATGGIIGGYFGAKILKNIPDYILKIVFVIFLIYYSIKILFF